MILERQDVWRCERCGERRRDPVDAMRHTVACALRAHVQQDLHDRSDGRAYLLPSYVHQALLLAGDSDLYTLWHMATTSTSPLDLGAVPPPPVVFTPQSRFRP